MDFIAGEEIERTEQNALLTRDPQYADIRSIFYIKVNPTVDGIIDAARRHVCEFHSPAAEQATLHTLLDGFGA